MSSGHTNLNLRLKARKTFKKVFGFAAPIIMIPGRSRVLLDIVKLDKMLGKLIPEYNGVECTYKDEKGVSLNAVVLKVYGQAGVNIMDTLLL